MKKIAIMLLAVLIVCVPCLTAFAEAPEQKETAILAAVPATHSITFISSGGRIENADNAVSGHEEYARRSEQTFHIVPDKGKEIDKVLYGGQDVTAQVTDGYFTTPPLVADMTLEVIYKDAASPVEPVSEPDSKPDTSAPQISPGSDTAKTGDTTMAVVIVIASVAAVSLFLLNAGKKRNKNRTPPFALWVRWSFCYVGLQVPLDLFVRFIVHIT